MATEEKVTLSVTISFNLDPEDHLDEIIDEIYEALDGAGIEVDEVELLNVPSDADFPETFFEDSKVDSPVDDPTEAQ